MLGALLLVLAGVATAARDDSLPELMGSSIQMQLAQERRENAAIARLYENILDIVQCRLTPEDSHEVSNRHFVHGQPVQDMEFKSPENLGQIAGVAVDIHGRPVIFHRGEHVWEFDSFDPYYQYTRAVDGPISVNTVLTLNSWTGEVEDEWGAGSFYLPHGVYVDETGNVWLTDVALHQVFKFSVRDRQLTQRNLREEPRPSLVLGERFVPGSDVFHFCQPTAVAVLSSGEIVVADGYCNERIVIFESDGTYLGEQPPADNPDWLRLRVPHSLAILKDRVVCTADREHERIVCLEMGRSLKQQRYSGGPLPPSRIHVYRPGICRIFGISSYEDELYAVNGQTTPTNPILGFTINGTDGTLIGKWGPTDGSLTNPHSVAACPNGTTIFVSEIGPNVIWKFRRLTRWEM